MAFPTKWVALPALALGLLVGTTGHARADVMAYATVVGGDLLSVDLTTGETTLIGNTGIYTMEGLALAANGTLYGTDDSGHLYTLSTTTGAILSNVGLTGLGNIEGLAFSGNTLYATDFNSKTSLYSLNVNTAAPTLIAPTDPSIGVVRAFTATGDTTGRILVGSLGTESLYSINLVTGATAELGPINPLSDFAVALGSASDGSLYSLDSAGNAYSVSSTGEYTWLSNTAGGSGQDSGPPIFYLDMVIVPSAVVVTVPEPSSVVLCGIAGVVALATARYRRKRELA